MAADECHLEGMYNADGSECEVRTAPDGTGCDDGTESTVNDACFMGVCAGVDLCHGVICAVRAQRHEPGTCDFSTGSCDVFLVKREHRLR